MISPDNNGLYHPKKEHEIIDLINFASMNNLQVRVRGAAQSVNGSIYTDGYSPVTGSHGSNINIQLDQMRSVKFHDNMQVTVGGGCNLGWDPFDPSGTSKENNKNNLLYKLNQKGLGIQNIPDAVHQTIAGYISTGSQGGTMTHSFDDCVISIRLIDGNGKVQTFTKSPNPDDTFYAVGVSMGLLGVITSVKLQCVPAFNIIGQELVTNADACEFDFFGPGSDVKLSLKDYLSTNEFARMLWWPFPTLQRMISWKAKTMQLTDYNRQTGIPPHFIPHPYQPVFPKLFGSTLPAEAFAGIIYRLIAKYPQWLYDVLGNTPELLFIKDKIDTMGPFLYPKLIDMYFPLTSDKNHLKKFWDYWYGSLPMDTIEFSNNLINLVYTEFWVLADQAELAVNTLQDYYQSKGTSKTSYYAVEILGAKNSDFWMSPAYDQQSVRINLLRFDVGTSSNINYYQEFWDLFQSKDIPFRLHWGKFLPPASSATGAGYLSKQFKKWDDFLTLRKQMDPNNIFLNSYWKESVGN
jgi:D-arabinono-1,4-lactone oxidase